MDEHIDPARVANKAKCESDAIFRNWRVPPLLFSSDEWHIKTLISGFSKFFFGYRWFIFSNLIFEIFVYLKFIFWNWVCPKWIGRVSVMNLLLFLETKRATPIVLFSYRQRPDRLYLLLLTYGFTIFFIGHKRFPNFFFKFEIGPHLFFYRNNFFWMRSNRCAPVSIFS